MKSYDVLQIAQLKDILRSRGLRVSGNKPALIQRIREHRVASLQNEPSSSVEPLPEDDGDDDGDPFSWMGRRVRDVGCIPTHLSRDPLFMSFVAKLNSKYPDRFQFQIPDADAVRNLAIDKPVLLENMFNQEGQQETLKAYQRYTCMFIIFVLFYQPSDSSDTAHGDGPLFTFSNCAAFKMLYKDKTKRYTLGGDNGCTVTSLMMINQEQMVLDGWFLRERNTFESHLKSKIFKDHTSYFHADIEQAKPASQYNPAWKLLLAQHSRSIRADVNSNCVHNAEQ